MKTSMRSTRIIATVMLSVALLSALAACGSASAPPAATTTPSPTSTPAPAAPKALFVASGGLKALDPATGHTLWEQSLVGSAWGAPVVSGTAVVQTTSITTSTPPHARLDAFNATTGAPLWHQELGFDMQAFLGAAGTTLLVATSAVSTTVPGAPAGVTLSAVQSSDGHALWKQTLADTDIFLPICASDGMVYLLTASSQGAYRVSAFHADTGAPTWNKPLGSGTALGFTSGSGGVYVSLTPGHFPAFWRANDSTPAHANALTASISQDNVTGVALTAYRAHDGAQLWQATGFITVQMEADGAVYAIQGTPQSTGAATFTALAYDAQSGHQRWQSAQLGAGDLYQDKPVAVASSTAVYVFNAPMIAGDAHPRAYALQPASGAQIWTNSLDAYVSDSVASATAVYVVAEHTTPTNITRTLMALTSATGAPLWQIPLTGSARIALGYA
jgi:outer membrane protein assembly factor BamB